ncbi:MAG: hypothetical protein JSV19_00960 [Phycisphaerales bacterium]|nr:MAG: hypothetical protein JSV19_00960 [Phycisphaerales bacterium]
MNELLSSAGSSMRFGWAVAALVLVTAVPQTALAADRVVLGEEFTATW